MIENTPLEALTEQCENAVRGYVSAMVWANATCDEENCLSWSHSGECEHTRDAEFELADFSIDDQYAIREHVEGFILANLTDFREYLARRFVFDPSQGTAADYFGHDLALTENGHGAGFWDRGLGDLGDRLSEMAKLDGETTVNVTATSVSYEQ